MKIRYWAVGLMVVLYSVVSCQSDPYEPREDVVECGLRDGSKFILKSTYMGMKNNWTNLFGGHSAPRLNQNNFDAWYQQSDNGKTTLARTSANAYRAFKEDATGESLCLGFGKKNATPLLGFSFFSQQTHTFIDVEWDEKIRPWGEVKDATTAKEKSIRQHIQREELEVSLGAVMRIDSRIVLESSLVQAGKKCHRDTWKAPCPIVAVFKYVSLDNGKTWQEPVITTNAEIFELGRSPYKQSFIARPIRINGKAVTPDFPSAP